MGLPFSNDDVIGVMTSLLPFHLQNIGGAAAPPAPPFATSLHWGKVQLSKVMMVKKKGMVVIGMSSGK